MYLKRPGQCPGLVRAQKEQGGVVVIFQLDACIFQCLFCILFQSGIVQFRSQCGQFPGHKVSCFQGAFSGLDHVGHFFGKHFADRALPRLRGYPGAGGTAIDSRLGAAGIVAVHTAGRHRLQHMKINIQTLGIHFNSPFLRFQVCRHSSGKGPGPTAGGHWLPDPGAGTGTAPQPAGGNPVSASVHFPGTAAPSPS